jgi:pimeloyl-ACP methyl ester carboxylesterase
MEFVTNLIIGAALRASERILAMRFTLVHGGCHGAYAWERLIPELEALGHEAVAMDWPGHGTKRDQVPTFDGFRESVLAYLRPGDILVAHSTGCMVATLAADAAPERVRHFVFLAGPLPVEGRTFFESMGGGATDSGPRIQGNTDVGADRFIKFTEDGTSIYFTPDGARQVFYHDLDPDTLQWALQRLSRLRVDHLLTDKISVPRFWEAELPRSFIQNTDDHAFPASLAEEHCRRLGVTPLTIEGSHSPFFTRPKELAVIILAAIETTPYGPLMPQRIS